MADFDPEGNPYPDAPDAPDAPEADANNVRNLETERRRRRVRPAIAAGAGMGALNGPGSIGASFWGMLHPGRVQAEAAAVGAEIPSRIDIISGAAGDIATTADAAVQDAIAAGETAIGAVGKYGPWLVAGVVAWLVLREWEKLK